MPTKRATPSKSDTEYAASRQRSVQRKVDATDRARPNRKPKPQAPMQAGARQYPVPPFPKPHSRAPRNWSINGSRLLV
ncbi:MAG: short-chain dehydrogenase, partial [Mesorhizobium sp.]